MSSNKKLTLKRLLIFLAISFIPPWIAVMIMWSYYGEPIYAAVNADMTVQTYLLGVFGMMMPSVAHLITRLITKEGFKNSYLGFHTKGKMGYWTASIIVPLAYSAVMAFVLWAIYNDGMSLSETFPNVNMQTVGIYLFQIVSSVILLFPAFGEEWGWRGYMMPKLSELMPKPLAVLVGGIIWGLWHAPLTIAGHNFGVDYPGYPFAGIGMMCLMCVMMNALLTLLTEKTKSIYPAAFVHALNNNLSYSIMFAIFGSEAAIMKFSVIPAVEAFAPYIAVLAVIGIISFILLIKKDKTEKAEVLDKAA